MPQQHQQFVVRQIECQLSPARKNRGTATGRVLRDIRKGDAVAVPLQHEDALSGSRRSLVGESGGAIRRDQAEATGIAIGCFSVSPGVRLVACAKSRR